MSKRSVEERFMDKVAMIPEAGCWLWTGFVRRGYYGGYGWFSPEASRPTSAHRWAYQHFKGEIPKGMVLRHTCFTKSCVNPDHVRPGTYSENRLDPDVTNTGSQDAFKCGHPRTPANTVPRPDRANGKCRECKREWTRKARAQQ